MPKQFGPSAIETGRAYTLDARMVQDSAMPSNRARVPYGRLLAGSTLREALDHRVFVPGTWDPANVRGAGYDIRLSATGMIVPTGRDDDATQYFGPKKPRQLPLILEPGQTAVVSSEERFCLDFDIAGNIGLKFSLAAQGLLVLTGMALDPGFGRQLEDSGAWVAMADQCLHFVLANVGANPVVLTPGRERIAFLQLFEIEPVTPAAIPSLGWNALSESLFDPSSTTETVRPGGLAYFRNVKDIAVKVDKLERDVQIASASVDKIEKASNYVVVFGVFLVATTILGLVLNALTETIGRLPHNASIVQDVLVYGATGAYTIAVLCIVWIAVRRTK
jgi:deoxycytidine triphosphate deaminase